MCMRMHDEGQADGPCFIVIHINKYNALSVIDHLIFHQYLSAVNTGSLGNIYALNACFIRSSSI